MERTSVCPKTGVKKGTWSPEEDEVLANYITKNGHGKWKDVPKLAGLSRCGKSCRLRWLNYLDPIPKRGKFTKEEVDFIIEMRKLGYRWSKIASHLPRRTDNDIKNFYYTNLKKKDNDTPDRERPKPAGNDITIGEIQSSSIPILESSSMLPIPPQISGSSLCPHIEEPERETRIQIYEAVWEEGLSKDPHIPIPPSEEQTYPWDCEDDYDIQGSSFGNVSPQHFGSSSSQPISSQTSSHSSSSIDRSTNENHILKEPERDTIISIEGKNPTD